MKLLRPFIITSAVIGTISLPIVGVYAAGLRGGLQGAGSAAGIATACASTDCIVGIIGSVIGIALGLLGVAFLLLLLYAGARYMTSGGEPDAVKKAMGTIRDAVIGLVIITLAYSISGFILDELSKSVGMTSGGGAPAGGTAPTANGTCSCACGTAAPTTSPTTGACVAATCQSSCVTSCPAQPTATPPRAAGVGTCQ
ncbi:MAG: hypothetical protein WCV84_03010 [Patescibacteria group bacterium]